MAKFKAGDTITNGAIYFTIERVLRKNYAVASGQYLPTAIVDRLWTLATLDGEIVE